MKVSRNNCLKQTMLNSIGMFVMILRCWDFCCICMVVTSILVFSLLVEQQSWWRALREDPLASIGRTKAGNVQCHQGVTCKQGKSFITVSSHKIRFIEVICQSFGFQRRNISRNQSNVPKIVRCQTWLPKTAILKSRILEEKMTEREKKAWQAFLGVVEVFLRKNKDPN